MFPSLYLVGWKEHNCIFLIFYFLEVPKNNLSIGELLIAFFNYYANFNFNEYAISVYKGCIYSRFFF
jgi:hypothetical protein